MSAIGASFPGESGDMKMHSSQLAASNSLHPWFSSLFVVYNEDLGHK